jgi:hypothetical protein
MSLIKLSDDELSAVMTAAAPINVERRNAFLQQIASELAKCDEIGPGLIHRIVRETQRQFFDPPDLSVGASGRTSKYR